MLVVVVLALVALVALGSLTVITVRSGLAGATHDRFKAIALYAAEAGAAVAMDYIRSRRAPAPAHWSALVSPENFPASIPADLPGNGVQPGQPGYLFGPGIDAWYEVEILNNQDDPGFVPGNDDDARVILRATGHGPNNAAARLEIEVSADPADPTSAPLRVLGWQRIY